MKKRYLFPLMFLFFFLFLSGSDWLPTDVRLDTGDQPGANDSNSPQIACSGNNVYVVWYDGRDGDHDIYFNYSTDNGITWQATDIRLDSGDSPGANNSWIPQISCSGDNVYVVWGDGRNGYGDVYFNYSTDGGLTWQATDTRLDKGGAPGANDSRGPQISCSDDNVYVVWRDDRNGEYDIYFNYSTDGGLTWQASDTRLDTGDSLGANDSYRPKISSNGSNVYVAWLDERNGSYTRQDIYFNYSTDRGATWQATDIRLNTGDTPGANLSEHSQISSSGNDVYVVWEDERNSTAKHEKLDIYLNYSKDGGATWQATDIRLDTEDMWGSHFSILPQISCSGDNVYVVWCDSRNGGYEIFFNSSRDGGATWQALDIRLDTEDWGFSVEPRVSSSGDNVYVVWMDERNGEFDIYFNYSKDGGATWQATDIRLDTGDTPGASESWDPEIACSDKDIYVVWRDLRDGESDIYFNTAKLPILDIKANGSDGPITIIRSDPLSITVEVDAGIYSGDEADWWLLAKTPYGWCCYDKTDGWKPGKEVTLQRDLKDIQSREVLNMAGLPAGSYTFYFGVDMAMNGSIDVSQAYYDKVKVTITP